MCVCVCLCVSTFNKVDDDDDDELMMECLTDFKCEVSRYTGRRRKLNIAARITTTKLTVYDASCKYQRELELDPVTRLFYTNFQNINPELETSHKKRPTLGLYEISLN